MLESRSKRLANQRSNDISSSIYVDTTGSSLGSVHTLSTTLDRALSTACASASTSGTRVTMDKPLTKGVYRHKQKAWLLRLPS